MKLASLRRGGRDGTLIRMDAGSDSIELVELF